MPTPRPIRRQPPLPATAAWLRGFKMFYSCAPEILRAVFSPNRLSINLVATLAEIWVQESKGRAVAPADIEFGWRSVVAHAIPLFLPKVAALPGLQARLLRHFGNHPHAQPFADVTLRALGAESGAVHQGSIGWWNWSSCGRRSATGASASGFRIHALHFICALEELCAAEICVSQARRASGCALC